MQTHSYRKLIIVLLFIVVSLTWGTTWMAMKIAVGSVPPLFATGLRFLSAAPFLLLLCWIMKAPFLFPRGSRLFQAAVTIFYFAIPFTLMIFGERYTSSSLAAIIFSTMPAAVLAASIIFLKESTSLQQVCGLAISLTALAAIIWLESHQHDGSLFTGVLALIAAVCLHAIMYVQCKKRCHQVSVMTYNALPCLMAGMMLTATGWLVEKPSVADFTQGALMAIVYLGVVAGVAGILCYFLLQKLARAFQASLVFLVFPLIAIALEAAINGNPISPQSLWLMLPFLSGILLTLFKRSPAVEKMACDAESVKNLQKM